MKMIEDDRLLEELLDGIVEESMKQQEKHEDRDEENKWYVTSLFKCRKKMEKLTKQDKAEIGRKAPVLSGNCFEDGLNRRMKELGFITQDDDDSGTLYMTKSVGKYLVTGRMDYYHPVRNIAIELKHPIYPKNPPKDNYVCQCKTYNWMEGVENNNPDVDKLLLWQISSTGMESHWIQDGFDDDDILAYIECGSYPFFEWECKYCDYDCSMEEKLGDIDLS